MSRITVVVSQGQSHHPDKRGIEERIVAELAAESGIDVLVIPHLYDLPSESSALLALRNLQGNFILLSWLYPRAAHWTLDQFDVRGRLGQSALQSAWDARKKKWEQKTQDYRTDASTPRVLDERPVPDRTIYHLDLRMEQNAQVYLDEIRRLAREESRHVVPLLRVFDGDPPAVPDSTGSAPHTASDQRSSRRWYPVIDYSRCTNCMECIDFCLFGVYGIDQRETILVEQPDNCRKGCPACSRVCPEHAIIFPQHKTPVIAGDPSIGGEMKLDLSQLFGKPSDVETAARERDHHLRLAGRSELGAAAGSVAGREAPGSAPPQDELDALIDELDQLDL
jgi:NAD-dependent dihydropyrimidine dehydrogenase PreA subunit